METSLNVLVWMSLSASQRQKLEQAGAGCHFFYMEEFPHPESLVPEADGIIGNVPPEPATCMTRMITTIACPTARNATVSEYISNVNTKLAIRPVMTNNTG